MKASRKKVERRNRRKRGLRKRIRGTAERPRLTVFRSNQNIYAQIIDDDSGVTLCEASTRNKDLRDQVSHGGNVAAAKAVGAALAERAKSKAIETICFDRNGYKYHGRIKALAETLRESGLKF